MPGVSVCIVRLRGASAFTRPGSSEKKDSAVLVGDAGHGVDKAGAEAPVVRLDQADRRTRGVRGGEVDRAASPRRRQCGRRERAPGVDACREHRSVRPDPGARRAHRDAMASRSVRLASRSAIASRAASSDEVHPAHVAHPVRAERRGRGRLEPAEHVEQLERERRRSCWADGTWPRLRGTSAQRRAPGRPVARQVIRAERRTLRLQVRRRPARQRALVGAAEPSAAMRRSVAARAGSRTTSPVRHARPSGRKTRAQSESVAEEPADRSTVSLHASLAGKPSASSIAGPKRSRQGSRPCRSCASPHERTAPGTVIGPRAALRAWRASPAGSCARSMAAAAERIAAAHRRGPPARAGVPDEPERVAAEPAQCSSSRPRVPRWSRWRRRRRFPLRGGPPGRPAWRAHGVT